ncbi:hypothetical protein [Stanieria cyanosphaera]|nr:hypothetical protein [Stanieria cyanosphaera]
MSVSTPPSPSRVLFTLLPVSMLLRAFPFPLIAVVPVRIRFSKLVPKV